MKVYACKEAIYKFSIIYKIFAKNIYIILEKFESDFQRRWEFLEKKLNDQFQRVRNLEQLLESEKDEEKITSIKIKLQEEMRLLYILRKQMKQIQEKYARYRAQARNVLKLSTEFAPKAVSFLEEKVAKLESYMSINVPNNSTDLQSFIEQFQVTASAAKFNVQSQLPNISEIDKYKLPQGFKWVSLNEINLSDLPQDEEFKKITKEDMKFGLGKLLEVLEILQKCYDKPFTFITSYFRQLDQQSGKTYSDGFHSLQRTFEFFFGHDHIQLERRKGDIMWSITKGRHRVKVALELGWTIIPAVTIEIESEKKL